MQHINMSMCIIGTVYSKQPFAKVDKPPKSSNRRIPESDTSKLACLCIECIYMPIRSWEAFYTQELNLYSQKCVTRKEYSFSACMCTRVQSHPPLSSLSRGKRWARISKKIGLSVRKSRPINRELEREGGLEASSGWFSIFQRRCWLFSARLALLMPLFFCVSSYSEREKKKSAKKVMSERWAPWTQARSTWSFFIVFFYIPVRIL